MLKARLLIIGDANSDYKTSCFWFFFLLEKDNVLSDLIASSLFFHHYLMWSTKSLY